MSRKPPSLLRAALVLLLVFGFVFGLGRLSPDCGADSEAAERVRNLAAADLERLHRAVMAARATFDGGDGLLGYELRGDQIPQEFSDLAPVFVRLGSDPPIARLTGCLDHHVDLQFWGVADSSKPVVKSVSLISGEDRSEEVLWTQPN